MAGRDSRESRSTSFAHAPVQIPVGCPAWAARSTTGSALTGDAGDGKDPSGSAKAAGTTEAETDVTGMGGVDTVPFKAGRPELRKHVQDFVCRSSTYSSGGSSEPDSRRSLLFVCGPAGLVAESSRLAMQYDLDFHEETFEL